MSCLFYSNRAAQIPKPLNGSNYKSNFYASFSVFVLQFWTNFFLFIQFQINLVVIQNTPHSQKTIHKILLLWKLMFKIYELGDWRKVILKWMVARIIQIGSNFSDNLNAIAVNIEIRFLLLFQRTSFWDLFSCLLKGHKMDKRIYFSLLELLDQHTCRRLRKYPSCSLRQFITFLELNL